MWGQIFEVILGVAVGGLAGYAISKAVSWYIDERSLKEHIAKEHKEAFYALIKEKKKDAIKVDIFGKKDNLIAEEEITSDAGVSSSLRKGQRIKFTA